MRHTAFPIHCKTLYLNLVESTNVVSLTEYKSINLLTNKLIQLRIETSLTFQTTSELLSLLT